MDTSAADKLRSVAQQLVQAREAQGIPLEEIATKTFIPMRTLKALEAGETFKLPEPVFVHGFIRRYAKVVGLDGDALAKEIPLDTQPVPVNLIKEAPRSPLVDVIRSKSLKPPEPDRVMRPIFTYGGEPLVSSSPIAPKKNASGFDWAAMGRPIWLFPVLGAVLGFGLLAGAIAIFRPPTPEVKTTQIPSTSPIAVDSNPTPTAVTSPIVTSSPSVTSGLVSGPVKVGISLTDASWIQVVVDGEVKFDGTMEKGATQSWSGQKDVQISSGNAGAVKLVHNQAPAVVMGKAGQVETKKFSAKN